MPPLPAISAAPLRDLVEQLRFAPRDALRRDLERAEALAAEIDNEQTYPADWIAFRITQYRPESGASETMQGSELLADLSACVEHLSSYAKLDLEPEQLSRDELAKMWNISAKTIDRYRRKGLIARRVRSGDGRSVLAFSPETVRAFETRMKPQLQEAGKFSRVDEATQTEMIKRARHLRAANDWPLTRVAQAIGKEFSRSHETVRAVLTEHDEVSASPIFKSRPALSPRQRRLAWRATRRGIEPQAIAERLDRTRGAINRMIIDERATQLRDLGLTPPDAWHAEETAIETPHCTQDLIAPIELDLFRMIQQAEDLPPPNKTVEAARAAGARFLVGKAATLIADLPSSSASGETVDDIETSLRWAARLQTLLLLGQMQAVTRTLQSSLGLPLREVPSGELVQIVDAALFAAAEAVTRFDPAKGGRLVSRVSMAVTRVASDLSRTTPTSQADPHRATPRLREGTDLADWTRLLPTAKAWRAIEPDPRIPRVLPRLDGEDREFLATRYGWSGHPPQTLLDLAAARDLKPMHLARTERRAIRHALALARRDSIEP